MLWQFALYFFFFNDTATTEIYTLSLHDALPICAARRRPGRGDSLRPRAAGTLRAGGADQPPAAGRARALGLRARSEERTAELQSHLNLVCRLLLQKKKTQIQQHEESNAYV